MRHVTAKGKARVQTTGICHQCGRDLPHVIARVEGRSTVENQEAVADLQLRFPDPPARKPAKTMAPKTILDLRSLGCAVAEYPATGTPAWDAFVANYKQTLVHILNQHTKAPVLRRGRGKKKLVTAAP